MQVLSCGGIPPAGREEVPRVMWAGSTLGGSCDILGRSGSTLGGTPWTLGGMVGRLGPSSEFPPLLLASPCQSPSKSTLEYRTSRQAVAHLSNLGKHPAN